MKTSINKIRQELKELSDAIIPINSFFWGDLHRAEKENDLQYPVLVAYKTTSGFADNLSNVTLVLEVADLHYLDPKIDLNDIESDTEQWLRVIFNVINKSVRWKRMGKVTALSTTEAFRHNMNGDVVAGHRITILFSRRELSGICQLPIVDYDFEGDVPLPPSDCLVATYSLTLDNVVVDSGSIPSGGSESIPIDAFIPPCPPFNDVTVNINASLFQTRASGQVSNVVVQQNDINVGSLVGNIWTIPSCPTFTDVIVNINGLLFQNRASGQTSNVVVLQNGINVGSLVGSEWIVPPCPTFTDVIVNINGLLFQTRASGQTSSVVVKQGGVNVGSLVGSEWIVPVPATLGRMPIKTFQTTSFTTGDDGSTQRGAGVSLLVLPYNNPHGNTTRFTALDGTQTYTNSVAVDWLTWNTTTNTALLTYFGSDVIGVSRNFQAGIDHIATLTIATLTDWRMINKNELIFICEDETSYNSIDYAPFNIGALVIGTSTNSATNRLSRTTGGGLTSSGKTTGMRTLAVRVGTVTGTVIT